MESMFSITQLATRLHVCELTVSRWIKAGKLDYIELSPRRILIPESSVQRFLGSKLVVPPKKIVDPERPPDKDAKKSSLKNEKTGESERKMGVKSLRKEIARLWR